MQERLQRTLLCTAVAMGIYANTVAQVAPPATLTFTENDPINWAGGIATDGQGGSVDIDGLMLEMFAATSSFTPLPDATMEWHDATYYIPIDGVFNGLTPGPDLTVTFDGVPAMVIRSSTPSVNFGLSSIKLYDWGGVSPLIETFDDGVFVGSISPELPTDGTVVTLTASDGLPPAFFDNIDEIRMTAQDGASPIWIAFNDLTIGDVALPVSWVSFDGKVLQNNAVDLNWATGAEYGAANFEAQKSTDGINFAAIGSVTATGERLGIYDYQFMTEPIMEPSFFRLKQVDIDGNFSYSRTIKANPLLVKGAVVVFPNPVNDNIAIKSAVVISAYSITNITGRMLKSSTTACAGCNIDISDLEAGTYFLNITTSLGTQTHKLVKE